MKAQELVMLSDFRKYYFYGEEKLPTVRINHNGNIYNFDDIDWNKVERMKNGYYNYSHALSLILDKPDARFIAIVFDKVLKMKIAYICHEDDTLYMEVE